MFDFFYLFHLFHLFHLDIYSYTASHSLILHQDDTHLSTPLPFDFPGHVNYLCCVHTTYVVASLNSKRISARKNKRRSPRSGQAKARQYGEEVRKDRKERGCKREAQEPITTNSNER
jgi:hypothetical protein